MTDGDVHIDCDSCAVRGSHCGQCVVSVLLGMPQQPALDPAEQAAIAALAEGGLVPPLRLAPVASRETTRYSEYGSFTVGESIAGEGYRAARRDLTDGASEIARRKAVS